MLVKAAVAVLLVWLLLPRDAEIGVGRPAQSYALNSVERVRVRILDAIVRVRADLQAHRHSM